MPVGLPVTKNEIDTRAGDIARRFQKSFDDVATMQGFLARTTSAELEALGFTADEVATLKTAFADLSQLGKIWGGLEPLATAKDFRTFVSRLWGVGSF
jgi:hypothetical protein